MKPFDSVTYFLPLPTGEVEYMKHPHDADRIIHSVPLVKRQPISAIVVAVHDGELLDLVFVHPSRVSTLSSGDWQNALERAYGVRPEGHPDLADGDERLGYYEENLPQPKHVPVSVEQMTDYFADLKERVGKISDPLPSAADLDAVDDEQKAADATS